MKHPVSIICAALAIIFTGCSAVHTSQNNPSVLPKLKVGFFVGDGSSGHGVFHWARLLKYSPQLNVTLLDGADIRNGKLDTLDLLFFPGGSSIRQYRDVSESGAEKIRDFVKKGGAFVGICAGAHCSANRSDRFRLMPYHSHPGRGGYKARLQIEINKRGAELLDIKPGKYFVDYSRGPVFSPMPKWEHGQSETIAFYRSTVSRLGKESDFLNTPAMFYGNYGKGKVIGAGFHPEKHHSNNPISMGCIYAVSGRKATPVFPEKSYRPVRVGFIISGASGKEPLRHFWELDRHRDLDVTITGESQIDEGFLYHADVLIIPDDNAVKRIRFIRKHRQALLDFMTRNGKIIIGEKLAHTLPSHKNLTTIPSGTSFAAEALKEP